MANKIQVRRDTAANWAAANTVLSAGESGYETDTKKSKIGDGTTAWNSLGYQAPNDATLKATYAKLRFLNSASPFAKNTRALNGYQAKGFDQVDNLMWYADSTNLVTSADHGVTLSAAKTLPAGVTATNIKKVVRAGGYIWLGAIDSGDGRTKVWRHAATTGDYTTWSASLVTMTANGGLLSTGMSADASYVYIGDYGDPTGGAHVWRGDLATGTFTDVTPAGIVRHIHAIKADPYNAGHVWMTTGDSGARTYRSTNYGLTWTLLDSQWQSVQISFSADWVYLAADSAIASVLVVDRSTLQTKVATPTWHYEVAVPGGAGSRVVTDLVTTGSSTTVTSATANFTSKDIGRRIDHSRTIDPMTYITAVGSSTSATLSTASWGSASGLTGTIFGDQFYDKAFYGAVDPATGVYYCIANDNSGKGTRSGLFMLPGIGEPMQLVQTFSYQIAGEMFIEGGYIHSHEIVRPIMTFA